jgi:hypothetical protein
VSAGAALMGFSTLTRILAGNRRYRRIRVPRIASRVEHETDLLEPARMYSLRLTLPVEP